MPKLQTLLGDGCAVVVGLPKSFNLSDAIRSDYRALGDSSGGFLLGFNSGTDPAITMP